MQRWAVVILLCALPGLARAEDLPSLVLWMRGAQAEVTARAVAACGRRRESFDFLDGASLARQLRSSSEGRALAARMGAGQTPAPDDLAVIARWSGAQFVVVVEPPGATGRVQVTLHSRRGHRLTTASTPAAGPHDRLWIAFERAARADAPASRTGCGTSQPPCGPVWFWAAAGTVVLGAVVTGLLLGGSFDGATTERLVDR